MDLVASTFQTKSMNVGESNTMTGRLELGKKSMEYLRSILVRWGGLWRFIGERDLEQGTVFAYFPKEISDPDSVNFKQGLFDQAERERGDGDWSHKNMPNLLVRSYLGLGTERLAILHAPSLRSNQSYSLSRRERLGYLKRTTSHPDFPTEVYQYHAGGTASFDDVKFFMELAYFWSMTCALTSTTHQLACGAEVNTEFLLECALKTEHILMSACDGDITLVWSADKASQDKLQMEIAHQVSTEITRMGADDNDE